MISTNADRSRNEGASLQPAAALQPVPRRGDRPRSIEERILHLVFRYRRRPSGAPECSPPCEACLAPHASRVRHFVERGEPVHFVLPAFPAKSPNREKVLGTLPDLGESLAIDFLQAICDRVRGIYAPGARVTICSDGRVFSDLVQVPDGDVTAYTNELRRILHGRQADALEIWSLDDEYRDDEPAAKRGKLLDMHGTPLESIRRAIKSDPARLYAFNGVARFLFEDLLSLEPSSSRNALRQRTKRLAYEVLQRSMAWSDCLARRFPRSVRLSIHPQPDHAAKLGIHLLHSLDDWLTPWHGVAVDVDGRFVLTKRRHAEEMGAVLVTRGGRPSHYVLSSVPEELES